MGQNRPRLDILRLKLNQAIMATALLLNSIAMIFASYRFIKNKLVMWKVAVPILIVATALSPIGAYVSTGLNREVLLWLFVTFLLFGHD